MEKRSSGPVSYTSFRIDGLLDNLSGGSEDLWVPALRSDRVCLERIFLTHATPLLPYLTQRLGARYICVGIWGIKGDKVGTMGHQGSVEPWRFSFHPYTGDGVLLS